jgi:hypothetical protein
VIREDPQNPRVLYVGTESGLFVSIDGGGRWIRWKGSLPHTGVRSLAVQARERELVVGTFGRAMWIADIGPLAQLEEALRQRVFLFNVTPAVAHNIRYTYGSGVEEINGDLFFRAANPPYGTLLTYYLREDAAGEARLTIRDSSGTVVRSLKGSASAGLHRLQWDLESDKAKAMPPSAFGGTASERQRRARVLPGTYQVTLDVGGTSLARSIEVRAERPDRARRVWPR